jgi:hypothetical protein
LAHGQLNYKDSVSSKITEITYAGLATVAVVGCPTCHDDSPAHDPHVIGGDYQLGAFPLRVPSGATDYAVVERSSAVGTSDGTSAGNYRSGNACMWCHKSRKDVTNYIIATGSTDAGPSLDITSTSWGPHHGPQTDIYSGKGGYHYSGKTYGNSSHQNFSTGCVQCHMPDVTGNGNYPDHSFYAKTSACTNCHGTLNNFDVLGGQSEVKAELQNLRVALNNLSMLTRDGVGPLNSTDLNDQQWDLDNALPKMGVTIPQAGALYNYFVVARGSAFGVHNPRYTGELLYDSLQAVGGTLPPSRP